MTIIKHGPQSDDWFKVEVVTIDIDGESIEPTVHLKEGLCPDVWYMEPAVAHALGSALIAAASAAMNRRHE